MRAAAAIGRSRMNQIVRVVWLVAVWIALWGDVSIANVLSGTTLAVLLLVVFPVHGEQQRGLLVRPLAVVRLLGYYARTIVTSNVALARAVVSRDDRLRTGVLAVRLPVDSDGLITIFNHLIALTPGTSVIEVEPDRSRLYVHILQLTDIESARAELARLELLIIEAFAPIDVVNRARATRAARSVEAAP